MITPITGSFFEFEHPDLAALGIDTLVLLATALRERAYYSGSIFPQPEHFFCKQPL